ncbi:hypothetical protein M2266_006321 [Streptomyces sp. SPB162]|nr:hypothetical protein [Streptomyces sp. SPB162]
MPLSPRSTPWELQPRRAAHRVALLPQSPQAPEAVTVAGLVRYGRHPYQGLFRQWSREDETAVRDALEVTGVADLARRRIDQLSGAERRIAGGGSRRDAERGPGTSGRCGEAHLTTPGVPGVHFREGSRHAHSPFPPQRSA